jgi:PIN domain nuclease of toxin-antitoxin system
VGVTCRQTALTIIDRENMIFVSSISGFEIATKASLGKLPDAEWISPAFVAFAPTSTSSNCR